MNNIRSLEPLIELRHLSRADLSRNYVTRVPEELVDRGRLHALAIEANPLNMSIELASGSPEQTVQVLRDYFRSLERGQHDSQPGKARSGRQRSGGQDVDRRPYARRHLRSSSAVDPRDSAAAVVAARNCRRSSWRPTAPGRRVGFRRTGHLPRYPPDLHAYPGPLPPGLGSPIRRCPLQRGRNRCPIRELQAAVLDRLHQSPQRFSRCDRAEQGRRALTTRAGLRCRSSGGASRT